MSLGRHAFQTCICSLIVFNSFFVLYLMYCFGSNPLYIDFAPIEIMFCSVLHELLKRSFNPILLWSLFGQVVLYCLVCNQTTPKITCTRGTVMNFCTRHLWYGLSAWSEILRLVYFRSQSLHIWKNCHI